MSNSGFTSMIFDSSSGTGAYMKSADGSTFTVDIDNGVIIPSGVSAAYVSLENAFVYNNVSNIAATSQNNKIYVNCAREVVAGGGTDDYILTIPDGLYNPRTLDSEIKNQMDNTTIDTSVLYPFQVSYNTNNKIVLKINSSTCAIDFRETNDAGATLANNKLCIMLGFAKVKLTIPTSSNTPYYYTSTALPKFNVIEYFIIACDFTQGIPINQKFGGYLAQVPINVEPGLQIVYEPRHTVKIPCTRLIGNAGNKSFTFRLLNEEGRPINTNGEKWSFRLRFSWFF